MPTAETRLECLQILKLFQYIHQRNLKQIEKLLTNGVPELVNYTDPNNGQLALNLSVSINDVEMVRFLLEHGANPDVVDSKGRSALIRAAEEGNVECIEILIKSGADLHTVDLKGQGPLFYCLSSSENHFKCSELLIRYGADVNNRSYNGLPVLVQACDSSKDLESFCLLLLDEGADPDSYEEKSNRTALMAASSSGSSSVVRNLLDRGCIVNSATVRGTQAVHEAAQHGYIKILQLLTGWGCDMNAVDGQGNTPLHCAAKGKQTKCCKFIFQRGCNPKIKNKNGLTAKMLAKEEKSKTAAKECNKAERSFGKTLKHCEPWAILLYDYCSHREKLLLEIFENCDVDKLGQIQQGEFFEVLKDSGAPLPGDQKLLDSIATPHLKEKLIDYRLFLTGKKYISKQYRLGAFNSKKKKVPTATLR